MKHLKYLTLILFTILFSISCKKSAIDFTPQDQLSNSSFWKTENDATLALTGCYSYLSNRSGIDPYDDGATDNAYSQYPWESNATAISAGNINATLDQGYGSRYQSIRRYNEFLDNIGKVVMNADLKKRYIAEVKALRALTYFELTRLFGSVPLLTKSYLNPIETAVTPTSQEDVVKFVITELKEATTILPKSYTGGPKNETGRITSGAAWSILTRVYLQYSKWEDAVSSAEKVMNLGYQLYRSATPDTRYDFDNFMTFANQAEKDKFYKGIASYERQFWEVNERTSKEIILSSQNITNSSYEFGNALRTLFPPGNLGGWSSITPTQDLINAYWDKSGNLFTPVTAATRASNYNNGNPNTTFKDEFKNRDTRLYASLLFPGIKWSSVADGYEFVWNKGAGNSTVTGYNFRKMVDPAYINGQDFDGGQDYQIIRYAEILLSYAEAKNELSGPDATIYAALNDVRDRSGMPAVNEVTYGTKETLRQLIKNERRIELAGEGQRFYDIRRWNIAPQVMKTTYDISNNPIQERIWQAKFMLMPYPQSALDHNPQLKSAQSAKGY